MSAWPLALLLAAAFAVLRSTKLPGSRGTLGDLLWSLALAGTASIAARSGAPVVVFVAGLLLVALIAALVLDVIMWRTFTIELGPRGAGDVVLSVLAEELGELSSARRFLRAHRTLILVPTAIALAYLGLALGSGALGLAGAGALAIALAALQRGRAPAWPWAGVAGAVLVVTTGPAARAALAGDLAWVLAPVALAAARPLRERLGPSLAGDFLLPRPIPRVAGFVPRPEHARLLALTPAKPARSDAFGLLRGADVLLVTVESLGSVHPVRTPFLDALAARGLRSKLHLSPSPTTNHAHEVLYRSRHAGGESAVRTLAAAGYETIYLTTANTRHYGLAALLERAGFERVLDRRALGPGDRALITRGVEAIGARRGPRFVHVQTIDSHVPYTVRDPRFLRGDGEDDLSRYLASIEEADAIAGELAAALTAQGVLRDPLVIVTGDHGQAFGALGYLTHGSAVTAEEVLVPFAMAHPALAPREVPWSSHFDVMPTVVDLLGLDGAESHGQPLVAAVDRPRELVLWAGHPSRTTTSCWGVLSGDEKRMIDLVTGAVWRMGARDENPERLEGDERRYTAALLAEAFTRAGLT